MRITLVAAGDLARSPRTLDHALSIVEAGGEVDLIGYLETPLPRAIAAEPRIRIHPIEVRAARGGAGIGALLSLARRGGALALALARTLRRTLSGSDAILLQNPPALPTLPVAIVAARAAKVRLVVDWHNFGWTLLGKRFGGDHWIVGTARILELGVSRTADAHLAVSRAMGDELARLGIAGVRVLPDGAHLLSAMVGGARGEGVGGWLQEGGTLSTRSIPTWIAPMGWTDDDDLALLLEALLLFEAAGPRRSGDGVAEGSGVGGTHLPGTDCTSGRASSAPASLRLILSGKGPRRDEWVRKLGRHSLSRVQIETPFVPADEYPALLASADGGLSLHRSTSGVDLPMKIVEMHAVGLRVLALDYGPALDELLSDEKGDRRFGDARELAGLLEEVACEGEEVGGKGDGVPVGGRGAGQRNSERGRGTDGGRRHSDPGEGDPREGSSTAPRCPRHSQIAPRPAPTPTQRSWEARWREVVLPLLAPTRGESPSPPAGTRPPPDRMDRERNEPGRESR